MFLSELLPDLSVLTADNVSAGHGEEELPAEVRPAGRGEDRPQERGDPPEREGGAAQRGEEHAGAPGGGDRRQEGH